MQGNALQISDTEARKWLLILHRRGTDCQMNRSDRLRCDAADEEQVNVSV